MWKMVKYEFRKGRTGTLVLLGILAALEVYFGIAAANRWEDQMVVSTSLLMMCGSISALFVFVRGITSYAGELRHNHGYLTFMTPNSGLKIVGAKFLYTFVNGLVFTAAYGAAASANFLVGAAQYGDLERIWNSFGYLLKEAGVYINHILIGIIAFGLMEYVILMMTVALAYLAVTVSRTAFGDRRWRWLPSLGLFFLMMWGVSALWGALPVAEVLEADDFYFSNPDETQAVMQTLGTLMRTVVVPTLLPRIGAGLGVILASCFGCAWLLDHKVNL